jgi:hypothetical protein
MLEIVNSLVADCGPQIHTRSPQGSVLLIGPTNAFGLKQNDPAPPIKAG